MKNDTHPSEAEPLCRKCGGKMKPGIATGQTYVWSTDFPGDTGFEVGCTINYGGPGKLIECIKCEDCGHSCMPAN